MGVKVPWYLGKVYGDYTLMYTYYAPIPFNYPCRWIHRLSTWWNRFRQGMKKADYQTIVDIHSAKQEGWKAGFEYGVKKGWKDANDRLTCMMEAMVEERSERRLKEYKESFDLPGDEA